MGSEVDRHEPPQLLAPGQVAALFEVTPKTISRWEEAGILPGERTQGGHRRFPAPAVYELLAFLQEVGEV
jgi:excisionase family DNA binding protein